MTMLISVLEHAEISFSESIPPFAKIMGITVFAVLSSRFLLQKRRLDAQGSMRTSAKDSDGKLQKSLCCSVVHEDVSKSLQSDSREKHD